MLTIYLIEKNGLYLKDKAGKVIEYFSRQACDQSIAEMVEAGEDGWQAEELLLPFA